MATTSVSTNLDNVRDRSTTTLPQRLSGILKIAGGIAIVASIALAFSMADGTKRLAHAWLLNGWFTLTISLGALFFVAIQHLVRAGWTVTTRRIAEVLGASISTPLLLMLPLAGVLLLGNSELFPWNDPEVVAGDKILEGKSGYLNAPFFIARALIYAVSWIYCGRWYLRASRKQDETGDSQTTGRLESRSAPVLLLLAITTTFAAFDWLMSLDPHWFSTIFGIYVFSASMVAALAVMAIVTSIMVRTKATPAVNHEHLHDVVKMLYGMNCFWAYIAFSQYLLIWYANIPEETIWLKHRQEYSWDAVTVALAIGHFVVPFIILMPRAVKRNTSLVILMSLGLLAMNWLDLYWIIYPQFDKAPVFGLMEVLSFVGFVSLFGLAALSRLRGTSFLPIRDPRLEESVGHVVH
jgi:hypothetical protein